MDQSQSKSSALATSVRTNARLAFVTRGLPESPFERFPDRRFQSRVEDVFRISWEQRGDSEVSLAYDCEAQGQGSFITYQHLFRLVGDEIHEVLNDGSTLPVNEHFDRAASVLRFQRGQNLNDLIYEHAHRWFQLATSTA